MSILSVLSGGWGFLASPKFWKIAIVVVLVAGCYFAVSTFYGIVQENGRLAVELEVAEQAHDEAMDEIKALREEAARQGKILADMEAQKRKIDSDLTVALGKLRDAEGKVADEKFSDCLDYRMPDVFFDELLRSASAPPAP